MLEPSSSSSAPVHSKATDTSAEISMTEDYGEPSDGQRTLSGGVDFFSTLGSEVKKKPGPEKPDPTKVCIHYILAFYG